MPARESRRLQRRCPDEARAGGAIRFGGDCRIERKTRRLGALSSRGSRGHIRSRGGSRRAKEARGGLRTKGNPRPSRQQTREENPAPRNPAVNRAALFVTLNFRPLCKLPLELTTRATTLAQKKWGKAFAFPHFAAQSLQR